MFTSRRFAPPRTCSSATSTAAGVVVRLDQPAEARRAGDVRPLADHHEARVRADLERLEPAEARAPRRLAERRAAAGPATASAIAATCSGVVPQQPPTTLTSPSSANSPQVAARVRRAARRSRRTRSAGRRSGGRRRRSARRARGPRRTAASRVAPSEQLTPTISGSACSTEIQNASTVWPERLRPLQVDRA